MKKQMVFMILLFEIFLAKGVIKLKKSMAFFSILFGILACVFVFVGYFKTPPLAITIFSVLGIMSGMLGMKDQKISGMIGILLSIIALVYLLILFAGLG